MNTKFVQGRSEADVSSYQSGEIGRDVILLHKTENIVTGITVVYPNSRTRGHAHPEREEHYFVLSGAGMIRLGDEEYPINEGDGINVPPVSIHTVINPNDRPLEFFWAAFPDEPKISGEASEE